MNIGEEGYAYSLFLARLYEVLQEGRVASLEAVTHAVCPLPARTTDSCWNMQWTGSATYSTVPQPFLGYFHFLPPHLPYHT